MQHALILMSKLSVFFSPSFRRMESSQNVQQSVIQRTLLKLSELHNTRDVLEKLRMIKSNTKFQKKGNKHLL